MDWEEMATILYNFFNETCQKQEVISQGLIAEFLVEGLFISRDLDLAFFIAKRLALIINGAYIYRSLVEDIRDNYHD